MEGIKVVSAEEMARIEKGGNPEIYMAEAGRQVAEEVIRYVEENDLPKQVTLLVGRGNNGGDAYAAGAWLLEEGYKVHAYSLYQEGSALNHHFREKFRKKRGRFEFKFEGLILDGLLGTGLKGNVEKKMAALIEMANGSGLPIMAIDIPSGLDGTTGEVRGAAIVAQETLSLGLPKIGYFIHRGWERVGKLHLIDFGLSKEAVAQAEAVAYLPRNLALPKISRTRHKYEAGYVLGFAGSRSYCGAPKMAGLAALRAGAGIVRIFHRDEIGSAPVELICNHWNEKEWKESLKKANAVLLGPGLGNAKEWLHTYLKQISQPCVIDADALLPDLNYPKLSILTPHRGEMLRLLGLKKSPRDEELFAKIIRFCAKKNVLVVLKGAPTFVFRPNHKPIILTKGDPGMATAGAGDVLTGVIAAFLAQGCSPCEAAVLGGMIHGMAGEAAADQKSSYSMIASDIIESMPAAFQALIQGHDSV